MQAPKIVGHNVLNVWNENENRLEHPKVPLWDQPIEKRVEYVVWTFKCAVSTADIRAKYAEIFGAGIPPSYTSNILARLEKKVRVHRIYRGVWLHDDNRKHLGQEYDYKTGEQISPARVYGVNAGPESVQPVTKSTLFDEDTPRPSLFD